MAGRDPWASPSACVCGGGDGGGGGCAIPGAHTSAAAALHPHHPPSFHLFRSHDTHNHTHASPLLPEPPPSLVPAAAPAPCPGRRPPLGGARSSGPMTNKNEASQPLIVFVYSQSVPHMVASP
jgi:hypothetical protein